MRFTILRSKAVSRYICDKQHQPPLVTYTAAYMPTTLQHVFKSQLMFGTPVDCFFPIFKGSEHGSS